MLKYYIDESGHSGDLASNTGDNFDFAGQPYFALAGVGVVDLPKLEAAIAALRIRHRIPTGELKSKGLQSKSAFVADLLNLLIHEKCQLFVEVVDKRFFVCIQIVNMILLHTVANSGSAVETWMLQNRAADWLYKCISEHVLNRFVDACRMPSDHTLMSAFGSLFLVAAAKGPENHRDFNEYMEELVLKTIKAYGGMRDANPSAYLLFLPIPDDGKNAQKIWMLPNFSSLTNLYARINLYHRRRLSGITLVHDHQLQLDEILKAAKAQAETVGSSSFMPNSDYQFNEKAALDFCGSGRCIGIQCADVLAGTVMRYFRDTQKGVAIQSNVSDVMSKLLEGTDVHDSFGINQVVPTEMVLRGS
jgi:hypothetical protein